MERQPSWERVEAVRDVACTLRVEPVALSPQLEEIDLLGYILEKPALAKDRQPKFHIILNVHRLQPNEVAFSFPEKNILELRAVHDKRLYCDDVSFSRAIVYRWHLPETVTRNCLQALWTFDNFLVITSTKLGVQDSRMKLVPQRISKALRPFVDLNVLTEILEDLRDTAQHSLRFIRMNVAETDGWDPDTFSMISVNPVIAGPSNA